MKKYCYVLFLMLLVIAPINVLAQSKNSDEIITGTYQFSAIEGDNKQLQNTFVYKDSDFTKSSFKGSKSLETLSIQVAGSSLSWYGKDIDKYEIDCSQNDHNIKDFMNKMEFNNIESNKYYNLEKKENSIGVIIGQKTIIQDGKEYTLLAIIPRSAGYKQEWAGDFIVGAGDFHEGFKSARDEILRFTKQYIEKNNIKGNLKVWTSGYSRGAAISNMVAGFFAGGGIEYFGDKVSIAPEDVYCYTIGTPSSVKNGASKNVELSVSANRLDSDYVNDTKGEAFNYTKGGVVSVNDSVYNGIRNIISPDDVFSLLPPEQWGFTRYGKVVNSHEGLYSTEELLKELKSVSEYVYGEYTTDGKIKEFSEKTFDLKTLSIVDKKSDITKIEFFKDRLNGLAARIGTNKIYNDEYQKSLSSALGTYGMVANIIDDIEINSSMEGEIVYPLIYSYLAYASEELQSEGIANSESEAVTIAAEDLLSYLTETEINKSTFTIDDFVKTVMKYLADNENEPVSDKAVSGIISLVPKEYQKFLSMFKVFSKNSDATTEESLKAFIRACYYGSDPESEAYQTYQEPEDARQLLYFTMLISQANEMPELQSLMMDETGKLDGHGKFEDFIKLMLKNIEQEKDENGNVIKIYSNLDELADEKLKLLIDKLSPDLIKKSEELYGKDFKNDLQKQINNLKQNTTETRKAISSLFFYTEGGYDTVKSIENSITFIENAMLFAMSHYDEIYLSLARTSNRYDDDYDIIKGNNQTVDLSKNNDLSLTFSFDYYLFSESGKLFIDGKEVSKDKYTVSKGSTIITIKSFYLSTLQEGNHSIVARLNGKDVEGNFVISKTNDANNDNSSIKVNENQSSKGNEKNPHTGDNIMQYVSLLGFSMIGLIISGLYLKKRCRR